MKAPRRTTARYVRRVVRLLGVRSQAQYWALRDMSQRLRPRFGQMLGLWRCHFLLSEVAQFGLENRPDHATALAIQGCKALHQVAIDKGSWENAIHLLPLDDPLGADDFGGDEVELSDTHAYRKATEELKTKASASDLLVTTQDRCKNEWWWDKQSGAWKRRKKAKGGKAKASPPSGAAGSKD